MSFGPLLRNQHSSTPSVVLLEVRDRNEPATSDPIAWVLVSRHEAVKMHPADGRVLEASITLSYERLGAARGLKAGFFGGSFSAFGREPMVSLSSSSPGTPGSSAATSPT